MEKNKSLVVGVVGVGVPLASTRGANRAEVEAKTSFVEVSCATMEHRFGRLLSMDTRGSPSRTNLI